MDSKLGTIIFVIFAVFILKIGIEKDWSTASATSTAKAKVSLR
jgi:hypothetical protein